MKKEQSSFYAYYITIAVLLFILFNILVFAFNKSYEENFWSGYIFSLIGYLVADIFCLIPFFFRKQEGYFYAIPIIIISGIYIILQFFAGLCIIFIESISMKTSFFLQLFLLVIYLIVAFSLQFYETNTRKNMFKSQSKREFINILQVKVESILSYEENVEQREQIRFLYEQVRYDSENESTESSKDIEQEILEIMEELYEQVKNGMMKEVAQKCKRISMLLKERNTICKNRK